jgi:hypothetical protein
MIRVLPVLRLLSTLSNLSIPKLLPWIRIAKTLITLILFAKLDVTTRQAHPYVCIRRKHAKVPRGLRAV